MQNIFVTHNPFHVYMAQRIIKSNPALQDANNILLLEFDADYSQLVDHKLWFDVIILEIVGGSTIGHGKYKQSEKNINTIKNIINDNDNTQIFISDIAWPMNNRIYFDRQLRKRAACCLYSDGLGTYALPRVTKALFARGMIKSLNGLIKQGVRYKNYRGNQFGIDRKETRYIYAPNVNLIECETAKRIEVPFSSVPEGPLDMSKCLFLDQPGWLVLEKCDWHSVRQAAVDFLKSLDVKEYYYKNHRAGHVDDENYYKRSGFNIINTSKCAEQIVVENNFGVIVSYSSSALFNLKCMYEEKIRCISLFSPILSVKKGYNENTADKVIDLFNKVNVEVVIMP